MIERKKTNTKNQRRGVKKAPRFSKDNKQRGIRKSYKHTGVEQKKSAGKEIPDIEADVIRIIPLGGVEEVGKNMTVIEYGNDIIVFDAGIEFSSDEEAPGVSFIIPDITYLEKRKEKIKALFITHGHLDHIGGIPFIIQKLGNPPIYTREITSVMIKKRNEEFTYLPKLDFRIVEVGRTMRIGNLEVETFPVTHSIPDSMGAVVRTKHGNIVVSGDLKLDHRNEVATPAEEEKWAKIGKSDNILFIADSTNAEKPGFSVPEKVVWDTIEDIVKSTKGRIIIGTFASQFERMIQIISICEKYNKKVITEGRSIKTNIEIAKEAGLLKAKRDTIIPAQEVGSHPSDKIVVLATGAQGEEFAALMRISTNKHKYIKLNNRDTIILSSSVIPGNEISVQRLKDNLYRHDLKIIHYRASDVHSTGHGNSGELAWINKQVNARFFMPAYGFHSMLRCHAQAVKESGFSEQNIIIPDNGSVVEIINNGTKFRVLKKKASAGVVMVDELGTGDVKEIVVRDRKALAQDGMFVIVAVIDVRSGKIRKSPDIISRGFIYLKESQDLLNQTRLLVKKTTEDTIAEMHPINFDFVKNEIREKIGRFLFQQTKKRPMILPVILEV